MSAGDSVSDWIDKVKAGDERAAEQLWRRFFDRLLPLACRRLAGVYRAAADEEDVVLSTLETIFRRLKQGQFPELKDRYGLWRLLVTVTDRKASNLIRDQNTQVGGAGRVSNESALLSLGGSDRENGFNTVPSMDPTPEFAALMAEAVESLLNKLDDEQGRIALLKLEGWSNEEVATQIGRSTPTVERRLRLIRNKWRAEADGHDERPIDS